MNRVTTYHNPNCGTSRNVLAMIRNAGIEPTIVYYLETPLNKTQLAALVAKTGLSVRQVLRRKDTPYDSLGLDDIRWLDDQLLDFMVQHPILINRPIVVTSLGTRLCRPSESVLDILPAPQRGSFVKEDGQVVIDDYGQRVQSAD